ncbi:MAG: hypothetical protein WB580_19750, partial [Candidatus Binataceae bacterium]
MKLETLIERRVLRRKVRGIAAALLPCDARGAIAVEEFQRHLIATHRAGLKNAVNMDTGYVNYLSDAEHHEVLRWSRGALGDGVPFVAGAYIEGRDGDVVALYRR